MKVVTYDNYWLLVGHGNESISFDLRPPRKEGGSVGEGCLCVKAGLNKQTLFLVPIFIQELPTRDPGLNKIGSPSIVAILELVILGSANKGSKSEGAATDFLTPSGQIP